MIRIGLVSIDISHPKAFVAILNAEKRGRYVAVYNDGFRGDDEVESFIKNAGLECRVSSIDELAEMSDIGFIQGCNWDKHLDHAMPFINKGKPVFIDKPLVGNLVDCDRLKRLVQDGAVILGSSATRYAEEIQDFLAQPVSERGEIVHVYGTSGVDEFNYGIHIIEAFGGLLGAGAQTCRFCSRGIVGNNSAETFVVNYKSGILGTYTLLHGAWHEFTMTIMTTVKTVNFQIDSSKLYKALLDRICNFMETGVNTLASIDDQIESIKILLAGKVSRENKGMPVSLLDLPAFSPSYNGHEFEQAYAAVQSRNKIYL